MAKRRKLNKKQKITASIISAALVLAAAIISYLPEFGIPSWNDIANNVSVNSVVRSEEYPFSVHYIDVGQADCELIICGDDAVLVDSGEVDCYNTIKSYLDSQNIKQIDYFIITHAHSDHIGSADEIIKNYPIDNVIMTKLTQENTPTSTVYEDLLKALSGCSAKIIAANPGDTYDLNDFSFTILAPNKDYDELNNTSVVFKAIYHNNSFLFQGDCEKESEDDILKSGFDVSADVIKLGHHGSSTSTKKDYLLAVNPSLAVISCEVDNKYHHPSKDTVNRLEKNNIQYVRTDINGTIVVTSDGNDISVFTQR